MRPFARRDPASAAANPSITLPLGAKFEDGVQAATVPGEETIVMPEVSGSPRAVAAASSPSHSGTAAHSLRSFAIGAGITVSLLFVIIGIRYQMQMYADGSLFSYAVAVQDAWAFHCHNIAGRLSVYLFAFAPAQAYIGLTRDVHGGIALYGFLFFV